MITIGSLFSGIGGFELGILSALEHSGIPCRLAWQVEKDGYCRKVLAKHWPHVTRYDDVTTFLNQQPEPVDVMLGGFPCQDISIAGNMEGISGARSGLFYNIWDTARSLGCRHVLLENVAAVSLWGGEVLSEITRSGYDCEWANVSAQSVGAPHRRRRWFAVCTLANGNNRHDHHEEEAIRPGRNPPHLSGGAGDMGDPPLPLAQGMRPSGEQVMDGSHQAKVHLCAGEDRQPKGQAESRLGGTSDGVSPRLDPPGGWVWPGGRGAHQHDWEPPRVRPRVKGDVARLVSLGNAIVPQVAYVIGLVLAEKITSS